MKKNLLLIVSLLMFAQPSLFAQEKEVMTNEIVISLVEMGLTSDIINAKILSSEAKFDVSINALKYLTSKKVSSDIIKTMINFQHKVDSKISEKTGIFLIDGDRENQILPNLFSATKTRTLAAGLTYGIASAKIKSILNNANASLVVNPNDLEFVFYFTPPKSDQFMANDWWFRVTSAPTEFVLVKLKNNKKKNIREIETGKANAWVGSDMGVNPKSVIKCDVIKLRDGKFSVKPSIILEEGEYCFFYAGTIPQGGYTNQSVFDFSVQ